MVKLRAEEFRALESVCSTTDEMIIEIKAQCLCPKFLAPSAFALPLPLHCAFLLNEENNCAGDQVMKGTNVDHAEDENNPLDEDPTYVTSQVGLSRKQSC